MLWEQVDRKKIEELFYEKKMSDNEIADLYQVPKSKVQYKRRKYGLTLRRRGIREFEQSNKELYDKLNADSKKALCDKDNIDGIAKFLTHYLFCNGPVEQMHAKGKLSKHDMKVLNKFMVNRVAGLLCAAHRGEWLKLDLLYAFYRNDGAEWGPVVPDEDEISYLYNHMMQYGCL